MVRPGTVMYSDDWLDQDPRSKKIPKYARSLVKAICEAYQMGSTADAYIIWHIVEMWMDKEKLVLHGLFPVEGEDTVHPDEDITHPKGTVIGTPTIT